MSFSVSNCKDTKKIIIATKFLSKIFSTDFLPPLFTQFPEYYTITIDVYI